MAADGKRFAFIFPMASGHVNPSFPVARSLVERGHEVHYLSFEQMRAPVADAGATYHSAVEHLTEYYVDPELGVLEAFSQLLREHGLDGKFSNIVKVGNMGVERRLPGTLRFLKEVEPHAVVFCPLAHREAPMAAKVLRIPCASLLTTAGPGSMTTILERFMEQDGTDPEALNRELLTFEPELAAIGRLNAHYGLALEPGLRAPLGKMDSIAGAAVCLVTTCEDLQDPMSEELARAYEADGVSFAAVGPLLDRAGAQRAGGHKDHSAADTLPVVGEDTSASGTDDDVLSRAEAAHASGRPVVLVSMGTVITGDAPEVGWTGRKAGPDGQPRGLSGRELCQAAWAGVFDACGAARAGDGPLLVVAVGPQANPMGQVQVPPNALCAPVLPQVDILKAGVDLFLTHGGQNSFTEALSHATPVVVCPGFGDQPVNACKAVALGVGLKVDRPDPDEGEEAEAAAEYRAEVCRCLRSVLRDPAFGAAAARCAAGLRAAGGVPRAVEVVLAAAAAGPVAEHAVVAPAGAKAAEERGLGAPQGLLASAGA
mmetsp:Transcript_58176/g.175894  ORF Transcript_58176/g.175894 Transcript_58176/m.175894 type:complete len:542 (+) Transcript_58176:123-1748(+)